jgi:TonB family protein
MRCWVVGLATVAIAFAGLAEAAPSDARRPDISMPLEGQITNPDWLRRPTAEEMENYYPKVAQFLSLDGHATIICDVTAQGTTTNCSVESETPAGMGFGEAAVSLSDFFRMKPMTMDGAPVAGGKVQIPIRFLFPHDDDEAALSVDVGSQTAPSAKALELARRIVSVSFSADRIKDYVDATRQAVGKQFAGLSLTEQEQAAIDDYMTALAAAMPSIVEARAKRLAGEASEADLAAIDGFVESSAGQAYQAVSLRDRDAEAADFARLWATVRKEASAAYCTNHACLKPLQSATPAVAATAKP